MSQHVGKCEEASWMRDEIEETETSPTIQHLELP